MQQISRWIHGGPDVAIHALLERIDALRHEGFDVYVGATRDPDRRAREHETSQEGWAGMVRSYFAYDVDTAIYVERSTIAAARCERCSPALTNRAPGGEGLVSDGKYTVYLLYRPRRSRSRNSRSRRSS